MTGDGQGLSAEEREAWDVDPDEWPHTPPFHVFRALMGEDDNTWWRAGSGHGLNAYDTAIERVEELEARLAHLTAECDALAGKVAAVEAVADEWQHTPDHYCCHKCALRAVLNTEADDV